MAICESSCYDVQKQGVSTKACKGVCHGATQHAHRVMLRSHSSRSPP